ncbi:MAG: hypothetical protein IH588_12185 [Anaerolineales bacterium]|nr:hypothetical protein [Anaerolineales bacterium]
MKIVFQVLVILVIAALIGGLMYAGVSAAGSSSVSSFNGERLEQPSTLEGREFRPDGDHDERDGEAGFPGGVVKALVLMSFAGGVYSVAVWAGKKAKQATA